MDAAVELEPNLNNSIRRVGPGSGMVAIEVEESFFLPQSYFIKNMIWSIVNFQSLWISLVSDTGT